MDGQQIKNKRWNGCNWSRPQTAQPNPKSDWRIFLFISNCDCCLSFLPFRSDSLIWYSAGRLLRLGYKRRSRTFRNPLCFRSWTSQPTKPLAPFWARLTLSLSLFPFAERSQTFADEIMICKVMMADEEEEEGKEQQRTSQRQTRLSNCARQSVYYMNIRMCLKIFWKMLPKGSVERRVGSWLWAS